jgi:hypothetical protein
MTWKEKHCFSFFKPFKDTGEKKLTKTEAAKGLQVSWLLKKLEAGIEQVVLIATVICTMVALNLWQKVPGKEA